MTEKMPSHRLLCLVHHVNFVINTCSGPLCHWNKQRAGSVMV